MSNIYTITMKAGPGAGVYGMGTFDKNVKHDLCPCIVLKRFLVYNDCFAKFVSKISTMYIVYMLERSQS